jgi:hypothetical protein
MMEMTLAFKLMFELGVFLAHWAPIQACRLPLPSNYKYADLGHGGVALGDCTDKDKGI